MVDGPVGDGNDGDGVGGSFGMDIAAMLTDILWLMHFPNELPKLQVCYRRVTYAARIACVAPAIQSIKNAHISAVNSSGASSGR